MNSATKALNILTTNWFPENAPGNWVPNDYWRVPTICRTLIAAMELFDSTDYTNTIVSAYVAGQPYTANCNFYDDLSVWGGMYTKGYQFLQSTGNANAANFLTEAELVCSQLKQAADATCGGGVWWKRNPASYPGNFKASNASIGWAEASIDLYHITGNDNYLEDAKNAMDWVISKGLITQAGAVWGGLAQNCSPDPNNPPVIALQGNPLAPLWSLYKTTGDNSYLTAAQNIVNWAFQNCCFPGTSNIFMTAEDTEWPNQTTDWQWSKSGPCLFKGIFSMYLGALTMNFLDSGDNTLIELGNGYSKILQNNADTLSNNYPNGEFSMNWNLPSPSYTPTNNDQLNAVLQYSGCSVLLSAAAINNRQLKSA